MSDMTQSASVVSFLPSNSSPLERGFSLAAAEQPRPPVEIIASLYDPMKCPSALLPYLAWAFSVDLWNDAWSEEKKRAVIAAAPVLHRLKGTKPGLERHLEIVGAKLVRLRQPPSKYMPDPSMTKAEREAHLARFRQIRVYPYRSRGQASHLAFASSGSRLSRLFIGAGYFPGASDAAARVGRRAFLFDPKTGIEEPIQRMVRLSETEVREATTFEQFALPGHAGLQFFLSRRPIAKMFMADAGANSRVYSMEIRENYDHRTDLLHLVGVMPSARPIDVRPRKVRQRGHAGHGQHFPRIGGKPVAFMGTASQGRFRCFLPPTSARLRIYDQVFLHDADRLPDKRQARTFMGACHFGWPPHLLRARVQARGRRPRLAFGRWMHGFFAAADQTLMRDAVEAARVSKAHYEKLLLTTKTLRPATVADRLPVGAVSIGQWIPKL